MFAAMRKHLNSRIGQMGFAGRDHCRSFHFCLVEGSLQCWWSEADESQGLELRSGHLVDNRLKRFADGSNR